MPRAEPSTMPTPFRPPSPRFLAAYHEGLTANVVGLPPWPGGAPNVEPDAERRSGYALGWHAAHALHLRAQRRNGRGAA